MPDETERMPVSPRALRHAYDSMQKLAEELDVMAEASENPDALEVIKQLSSSLREKCAECDENRARLFPDHKPKAAELAKRLDRGIARANKLMKTRKARS